MGSGEELALQLVIMLVLGGLTAGIASSKGRSPLGWFFVGFFFGCIGLIIILCLSNQKEENAKWAAQQVEQQRLREQLRQEQIKNEALRQHTVARLDQHDQSLGVDTRQTAPALTNSPGSPAMATPNLEHTASEPPPPQGYPADNWYVDNNGTQDGPYAWPLIYRRAQQGTLTPDTKVWAEGMADWVPAKQVPNLFSA